MKVKSETVYAIHTDVIRATKDLGDSGGPNMWNLEVQTPGGYYEKVQWMNVRDAEALLGSTLTRYPEGR